jgi:hypothetical protein
MPGLFGGPNWLLVDVSKYPRADQYAQSPGAGTTAAGASAPIMTPSGDRISDVKNVGYFMAGAAGMPPALALRATGPRPTGLLRREADRAATVWSATNGGNAAGPAPESLAPEIVGIAFRYFDGQTWQQSWDSRQRVGLPKAVEIEVSFLAGAFEAAGDAASLIDTHEKVSYRMVVSPAGWRPPNVYATSFQQVTGQIPSAQPGTLSSDTSR